MIFKKMKDGGPESNVTGYWLCEFKSLFSICLLKFQGKSRESYHNHAFNSIAWVLKGTLVEKRLSEEGVVIYIPSWKPFKVPRERFHRVSSDGVTWVLNFRGPWSKTWKEYNPTTERHITLTNGREVVNESKNKS